MALGAHGAAAGRARSAAKRRAWASSSWPRSRAGRGRLRSSLTRRQRPAFHGAFVADGFARFAKLLILIGAALSILLAEEFFSARRSSRFELPVLMLFATLGMMLMVSASSFLSLYMGLELQSLALYVLAAFNRDHLRSTEAGLKYFVLGALSSGMLLYGISLIYGFTGTVEFSGVARCDRQGRRLHRADFRHRVPDRGAGLQGLRRAVPYVDAGCL